MSKTLKVSDDLELPLEFVTQTQAILARKRVGKSYTASVQAEEMLRLGQQVLVIDYTGAWWGLRAGRDGKAAGGYPIHVFGGDHADVPLEERAGEVIAAAAVKERFSAILDLSHFRKGEALRFLWPFLETLYRMNRDPLHLFADECDAYAPQRLPPGSRGDDGAGPRALGAMNDIVRRGGIRGIGCTLISQRPAVINKDILTMCSVLTCLRISHPKDLAPVREWVELHDEGGRAGEMLTSLPSLPIGTAWVWAAGWPTPAGIFTRMKVRQRRTFDSGATPTPGQTVKTPKKLKAVDLVKLGETIRQTAEQAKANDPAALKKKVAELQAAVNRLEAVKNQARPAEKVVEAKATPVVTDKQIERLEKLLQRSAEKATRVGDRIAAIVNPLLEQMHGEHAEIRQLLAVAGAVVGGGRTVALASEKTAAVEVAPGFVRKAGSFAAASAPLPDWPGRSYDEGQTFSALQAADAKTRASLVGPEQRVLDALAFWESVGVPTPVDAAVAFAAGYSPTSSAYERPRGSLRSKGLIEFPSPQTDQRALTAAGRAAAVLPTKAVTLEGLHAKVRKVLDGPQAKLFDALVGAYPAALTNDDLATAAGYSATSSAYERPRGKLRTFGLAEFRDGGVAATKILFPDGLA